MITELMGHLCSLQMKNSNVGNPSDPSEVKGNHAQCFQGEKKLYILAIFVNSWPAVWFVCLVWDPVDNSFVLSLVKCSSGSLCAGG